MPCYHPQTVYRSKLGRNPKTGNWPIVWNPAKGLLDMTLQVPCGRCIGCRLEYSRRWAIRCVHEAKMYEKNSFITLTYDNEHYPENGSLNKTDFPLFMKRLRKKYGQNIKFYHGAEYGTVCRNCMQHKTKCTCGAYTPTIGRPHHHACLFNFQFSDLTFFTSRMGTSLYISESLRAIWPFGFSTIGDVTFQSAAYVARYVTKKITGEKSAEHYGDKLPEHVSMSRKPGIGRQFVEKYMSDIYPGDEVIINENLKCRPPRYYDMIYDDHDPESFKKIKLERKRIALLNAEDNTPERLLVKEKCKQLKIKQLKRSIE